MKVKAVNLSRLSKIALLSTTVILGFYVSEVFAASGDVETIGTIAAPYLNPLYLPVTAKSRVNKLKHSSHYNYSRY